MVCTGEPTVNKQVIKPYAFLHGMPHHFNGTLNLALFIFPDTGVDHGFFVTDFAKAGIPLLACQPLYFFRVLALLAMKRKVKHGLCLPVGMAQEQPLEAEDAPV